MARLLAFEWDDHQLCGVIGTARGGEVFVEDIFMRELADGTVDDVAAALKAVTESGMARGCKILVALGRGAAEMRRMHLPPMPDDELPDAVRFQAVRQFASAGEKATIDFLPIARTKEGVDTLVAAVGPETIAEIERVARASEREISGIYLRPLGVSLLMRSSTEDRDKETLLIDMLDSEADFVVLRNGHPIFVRSIRLPDAPAARLKQLAGEVRRSLTACHQTEGVTPTHRIVIWGDAAVHAEEAKQLHEELNLPVDIVDPFTLVTVPAKLRDQLPVHRGRFAPLLGLIAAGGGTAEELIDFKHPRQRIEKKSPRNRILAYVAVAAVLFLGLSYVAWNQLATLDRRIANLTEESNDLNRFVDQATASQADLNALTTFRKSDVFWLNELKEVSESLPPGDEVILNYIMMTAAPQGGGTMVLRGLISDPLKLAAMEESLRNDYRRVEGDGAFYVSNRDPYNYQFTESITIAPQGITRSAASAGSDAEKGQEPPPENSKDDEAETDDDDAAEEPVLKARLEGETSKEIEPDRETSARGAAPAAAGENA